MRGKLNSIILNTLKDGNKYGLEIIKAIKSLTYGQLDIKLPSLYSNLHKLEAEGYITSYWENSEIGGKRRYSALTDKGMKYVVDHPYDFEEFKKYENVSKNTSSTLAIQPDFFNTIEHSKRISESSPTPSSNDEEDEKIPNYSILDYISENIQKHSNINDDKISNDENINNDYRVYDKTDAVLLSDNQIIPQDSSTSLLYKPTTLTNDDLIDDSVDYDSIFGEMIAKENNVEANEQDKVKTGFEETSQGVLLNPNERSRYTDDYLSMVSNKSTVNVLNQDNDFFDKLNIQKQVDNQNTNQNINNQNTKTYNDELQQKPKKADAYLLKEKVNVDDNLKANIFLKRQSNKTYSGYDFYNTSAQKTYKNIEPIMTQSQLFNFNKEETPIVEENKLLTLPEFIDDCENNGILVQRYRKNNTKLKSHRVYINKTNLLTSILSFATLIALMFICYFAFKESLENLRPISYLIIGIISCGIIYPIVYAVIAITKGFKLVGYYNMNKELIPRIIIFAVIILLTFAINFLCGLNSVNIVEYLPYIILPVVASFVIFIDYFYKSLLLQLKAFREE